MRLSHYLQIYPNRFQEELLSHYFGQTRYCYNFFYDQKRRRVKRKDIFMNFTIHREETDFLNEIPRSVQTMAMRNSAVAFNRFFEKVSRYPQKKTRSSPQKCQMQVDTRNPHFLMNWNNNIIQLPGLGIMKFRDSMTLQPLIGISPVISISKKANKYFLSYGYERNVQPFPVTEKEAGCDLRLMHFITTSDGDKIKNPRKLQQKLKYLKRQQRKLSRQVMGSNRREKQKIVLAKAHLHVANQRKDFHNKTVLELLLQYGVLYFETLDIAEMKKNKRYARSISDAAWGNCIRIAKYKAELHARELVQISQWYASSKICSACGHKMDKMNLSVRNWTCPICGAVHDRDINAAINIKREGIRLRKELELIASSQELAEVGMGNAEFTHEEMESDTNNILLVHSSKNRESVEISVMKGRSPE